MTPTLFAEVFEFDVDRQGRLWVFDQGSLAIMVFRPDGSLERRVGQKGSGPGEFQQNNGMAVLPDGRLAVWDSRNARISFFTPEGEFEKSWPHTAGFSTSNGVRIDTAGGIYIRRPVADPTPEDAFWRMGLVRIADGGAWSDSLNPPLSGVVTPQYVATSPDGNGRSSTNSQLAPRAMWTWHHDGYFVVGNGATYHITVARTNAKPIRIERDAPPVPVTSDERKNDEESIQWQMRSTNPAWTWTGAPIPETKAPLEAIFVARDGRIWARVAVPSEPIPEAERNESAKDGPPARRWRSKAVYEVFSADGTFERRVEFPSRTTLMEADGDVVWALGRTELGLPAVVRYRVGGSAR